MAKRYTMAVYDLNGNRLCSLYDSRVQQDGAAYGIKITKEIGGWKEVSFNLSKAVKTNIPNFRCDFIRNEYQIWLTEDDETDIYCIKAPAALHDKSKIQFTVSCNHISEELKTKNLQKYFDDTNGIGTCEELIGKAIHGSGWRLAACDKFLESDGKTEKIRSYSCDPKIGAQNMITGICELFDARPVFHGKERTIEIRAITNTEGWMEILFGKNSEKIKKTPDSSKLVTRLYVEGEQGDFGYVGIDDVNPTGLPFILNFDYYKELGVFTDGHQGIVDQYLIDYRNATKTLQELTAILLEKQAELNGLIGSHGYAMYSIDDDDLDFSSVITGGGISEENALIETGDTITLIRDDGSYIYREYSNTDSFTGYKCAIKFYPTITGTLAAYEDKIEASKRAIDSYLEKLNRYLRISGYEETTVDGLKEAYHTDDLSTIKDEGFNLSGVAEQYTETSVMEYAAAIGLEEKSISASEEALNEGMLKAVSLIEDIDKLESRIDGEAFSQEEIDNQFSIAMGSMLKDGYWSDTNYTAGQEESLQNDALEISKKLAFPTATYDIDTQNLSVNEKYAGEEFRLAQTVRIYDKDMGINDHGVVSKTTTHPDKPLSDKAEVKTDLLDIGTKSFASILERVTSLAEDVRRNRDIYKRAAAISKNGTINSGILEGAIDVMKTQLLSSASNWRTDENGNIIFTNLENTAAMMLCGSGFMIANSKLDNGDWNWRTFGTGDGFAADMIVTGFLDAERIAARSITVNHLASDVGESLDISSNKSISMLVSSVAQIGDIAPENPVKDKIWLDTAATPNLFKRWNGTDWEIINEISHAAITIDGKSVTVQAAMEDMDDRISDAELKVEPDKIVGTVRNSKEYQDDLSGLEMTAEKFEVFVEGSEGISKISEKADEIDMIVSSDSSSTELKLTDTAIEAITTQVKVKVDGEVEMSIGDMATTIKANADGVETNAKNISANAENINANAENIRANAEAIDVTARRITLTVDELTIIGNKLDEKSTVFRQETFPTSTDNVSPNDLLIIPSTGKTYQAMSLAGISLEFLIGDDGALYYKIDDPNGLYDLKLEGFDLYANGFTVPINEDGSIGTPYYWELVRDLELQAQIEAQAAEMAEAVVGINNDISNLQDQIDGNITTWFYGYVPTDSNAPASNWTTEALKNQHIGDLFYVDNEAIKQDGYCYRWMLSGGTYSWVLLKDADVTKALSDAANAQDTADNKRRVFVAQPTPPYDRGDIWVQGSEGDILFCNTAKTYGQSYSAGDWAAASKYTDDTTANQAMVALNSTVMSVDVEYYLSTSTTELLGGAWSTAAPAWENGKYMWSRTTTKLKNGTTLHSNITCIAGAKGDAGTPGKDGQNGSNGVGVSKIDNYYLASTASSGITTAASGWTTNAQNVTSTKPYLWNYEKITYTDGSTASTEPCIIGAYGKDGKDGADGTGVTILGSYSTEAALKAAHPTGNAGDAYIVSGDLYVWSVTENTWINVGVIQGEAGEDGVGIESIQEHYAISSSGTTAPTSWSTTVPTLTATNRYLWNYEVITYTNGETSPTEKRVIGVYGDTGATGNGVSSVVEEYCLSASKSTAPTSGWSTSVPSWSVGYYIWTRSKITYTNGSSATTTPYCDSMWEYVDETSIYDSTTPPEAPSAGKIWLDRNSDPPVFRRWRGEDYDVDDLEGWDAINDTHSISLLIEQVRQTADAAVSRAEQEHYIKATSTGLNVGLLQENYGYTRITYNSFDVINADGTISASLGNARQDLGNLTIYTTSEGHTAFIPREV